MKAKSAWFGIILIHLSVVFWGTGMIFQKYLVDQGFPLFYTIAIRFSPAFILLFIHRKKITLQNWISGAFIGMTLIGGLGGQNVGMETLDASVIAFLVSIGLVFIPLFNYFIYKTKLTKYNFLAVASVLIGGAIFNNVSSSSSIGGFNIGVVFAVCGSFGFTFRIILSNLFIEKGESPFNLLITQTIFVSLSAFILAVINAEPFPTDWTPSTIGAMAFLAIVSSMICYGIMDYGQYLVKNPLKTGLIASLEPVWAFSLAMLILGEVLTITKFLGMLFIGMGILFSEWTAIKYLFQPKNKEFKEEL